MEPSDYGEDDAFYDGENTWHRGEDRDTNPERDQWLRTAWFAGWDAADEDNS